MLHYYLIHRTALIVGLRSYLRPRPAVNSNMIFASSSCSAEVQLRAGGVPPSEHVTPLSLLFTREVGAQGVTAGSARPSPSSRTAVARIRRCKLLAQGTAPARAVPVYHFPVHSPWILRSRVSRPLLTSSQDPRSPRRAIFAGVSPRCASKTAGVRAFRALLTRGAHAPLSNAALRLFCSAPRLSAWHFSHTIAPSSAMHFAVSALLRLPGLRIVVPTCADCVLIPPFGGAPPARASRTATFLCVSSRSK